MELSVTTDHKINCKSKLYQSKGSYSNGDREAVTDRFQGRSPVQNILISCLGNILVKLEFDAKVK
ncbi:unnamed protein product [Dovyalis caffra]|uniref:Uncharacterized protein n=1 Tax=Dovyalis caffra TaxID=77055 RepID=A0AAV1QNP2_9ROSI|nr:unnamed protein product [Dovyalis caffra]